MKQQIFLLLALFAYMGLYAQSEIQIKDIVVKPVPVIETDSVTPNAELMSVMFKVNDITNIENAYILVGTTANSDDIAGLEANITNNGDAYFVNFNGETRQIYGNVIEIQILLDENQMNEFNFITAYAGNDTENSNSLIFQK